MHLIGEKGASNILDVEQALKHACNSKPGWFERRPLHIQSQQDESQTGQLPGVHCDHLLT